MQMLPYSLRIIFDFDAMDGSVTGNAMCQKSGVFSLERNRPLLNTDPITDQQVTCSLDANLITT